MPHSFFSRSKSSSPSKSSPLRLSFRKKRRPSKKSLVELYSDPSPKAPWRVGAENTPCSRDWWEVGNKTKISKKTHAENEKLDYTKDDHKRDEDDTNTSIEEDRMEVEIKFKNAGLENWERSRAQWRVRAGDCQKTPSVKSSDLVRIKKGLKQVQRTFNLPSRISLPAVIEVYQDIWHADDRDIK